MQREILYQIRLPVAGELGQHGWDVVGINGIPHAVVEHKEKSILALPLEAAQIYELPGGSFLRPYDARVPAGGRFEDRQRVSERPQHILKRWGRPKGLPREWRTEITCCGKNRSVTRVTNQEIRFPIRIKIPRNNFRSRIPPATKRQRGRGRQAPKKLGRKWCSGGTAGREKGPVTCIMNEKVCSPVAIIVAPYNFSPRVAPTT
jgi:hypothetical protein